MKIFRKLAILLALAALLSGACLAGEVFHGAYLQGYPDGTVRPEKTVTRAELAQILYRMMDKDAQKSASVSESAFLDVAPSHWAYPAIAAMAYYRLMLGGRDGRFRPDDGVTGQELSIILERVRALDGGKQALAALCCAWDAQEITFEAGNGWVMGLHGTEFDPDRAFTRGELAALLNRILGRTPQSLEDLLIGMPLFADNLDTQAPYFLAMQEAAIDHTAVCSGGSERWSGLG